MLNSVLAGPTASEGVGTFVQDLARQRGTTKEDVERQFFSTGRPTSLRADGGVVRSLF